MPFEYDFGKNFINTVLRIQDRKQRESQFSRELAQRTKQQGLLRILQERQLAVNEAQEKRLGAPVAAQPEDIKYKTIGSKTFQVGEGGGIDFADPVYTQPTKPKEEKPYDHTDDLADLDTAIANVENLLNKPLVADEEGVAMRLVLKKGSTEGIKMTQDDYRSAYVIPEKNKLGVSAASKIISNSGLEDAYKALQEDVRGGKSIDKALKEFRTTNDLSDTEAMLLRKVFRFESL